MSTDCNDNIEPDNDGTKIIQVPNGAPHTFAPYARTLPSSVSIPLCWKRNELAMLSGCIPGLSLLMDVAASTIHLVSEFIALLNAGILERFPHTFPPGLITWDRYVWAASVFSSRNFPANSYYNMGDAKGSEFQPDHPCDFQSPSEIWDELGVLIPLLDMFNHEVEDHQITWEQTCLSLNSRDKDISELNDLDNKDTKIDVIRVPRAIIHKKVKKGSEIYSCYGASLSNSILLLQYGFAQINNISDEVRMGWAISDAVGNVEPPFDFTLPYQSHINHIYESNDERAINEWWTTDRLSLLQAEACCSDSTILSNLKLKKKMTVTAYANGQFDPILLAAIIVATMPERNVEEYVALSNADVPKDTILISKLHQQIIRRYLQFSFTRKLEKLLQNLNNGLSDFFSNLKLWTKSSDGGVHYQPRVDNGESNAYIGWQTFFDMHAYNAAMEVEGRYYAMGTESCVLTLYDGQLRALQASLDVVSDSDKFESIVLKQLEDLGYKISRNSEDIDFLESDIARPEEDIVKTDGDDATGDAGIGAEKKSPRNRKRNRKRSNKNTHSNSAMQTTERPPALKLHIGNLAYSTTPANLYEYFTSLYGQDNVLECHIPIERETGKTRGFGFVAFPEAVAETILESGRKFEIDGRVLKVARSSSAGTVHVTKVSRAPPPVNNERCITCGYRPKYCACPQPKILGEERSLLPSARVSSSSSRNDPLINRQFGPNGHNRDDEYRHRDYRDENRHHDYDRDRHYSYHHDVDDHRYGGYDRDSGYYRESRRRVRDLSPLPYNDRDHSPHGSRSRSSSRRYEHDERDRSSRRRDSDDESDSEGRGRKRSRSEDKSSEGRGRKRSRSEDKSSRSRRKEKRRPRSRSSGSSRNV